MKIADIEALPAVKEATAVLVGLEQRGLVQPAIASRWTRALLTGTTPRDIDVAYVGDVHYEQAQQHLSEVLAEPATLGYKGHLECSNVVRSRSHGR